MVATPLASMAAFRAGQSHFDPGLLLPAQCKLFEVIFNGWDWPKFVGHDQSDANEKQGLAVI